MTFYERDGVWQRVPKPVPLYTVVRGALLNALAYTDGHQRRAGELLGLSQRQMTYNLQAYAIPSARTYPVVRRRAHVPRMRLRRVK